MVGLLLLGAVLPSHGGWPAIASIGWSSRDQHCTCTSACHRCFGLLQGVANVADALKEQGGGQHVVLISSCLVRCGARCTPVALHPQFLLAHALPLRSLNSKSGLGVTVGSLLWPLSTPALSAPDHPSCPNRRAARTTAGTRSASCSTTFAGPSWITSIKVGMETLGGWKQKRGGSLDPSSRAPPPRRPPAPYPPPAGEEVLRKSGLPYTVVRPGGLTNDPAGQVELVVAQGDSSSGRVARDDVAAVAVAALSGARGWGWGWDGVGGGTRSVERGMRMLQGSTITCLDAAIDAHSQPLQTRPLATSPWS